MRAVARTADQSVYFVYTNSDEGIENGDAGYLKVGIAVNVMERLRTLQTGCPTRLVLIGTWKRPGANMRRVEKGFHEFLEELNVYGEWFKAEGLVWSLVKFVLDEPGGRWEQRFQPTTLF